MTSPADKVSGILKTAKGPGDILKALSQDPGLFVGVLVLVAIFLLLLRIYIWPRINPFRFTWFSDIWKWLTRPPRKTPDEKYPYAKVLIPQ
jgi:hypothetical protein